MWFIFLEAAASPRDFCTSIQFGCFWVFVVIIGGNQYYFVEGRK
jgi:hypothetical protein